MKPCYVILLLQLFYVGFVRGRAHPCKPSLSLTRDGKAVEQLGGYVRDSETGKNLGSFAIVVHEGPSVGNLTILVEVPLPKGTEIRYRLYKEASFGAIEFNNTGGFVLPHCREPLTLEDHVQELPSDSKKTQVNVDVADLAITRIIFDDKARLVLCMTLPSGKRYWTVTDTWVPAKDPKSVRCPNVPAGWGSTTLGLYYRSCRLPPPTPAKPASLDQQPKSSSPERLHAHHQAHPKHSHKMVARLLQEGPRAPRSPRPPLVPPPRALSPRPPSPHPSPPRFPAPRPFPPSTPRPSPPPPMRSPPPPPPKDPRSPWTPVSPSPPPHADLPPSPLRAVGAFPFTACTRRDPRLSPYRLELVRSVGLPRDQGRFSVYSWTLKATETDTAESPCTNMDVYKVQLLIEPSCYNERPRAVRRVEVNGAGVWPTYGNTTWNGKAYGTMSISHLRVPFPEALVITMYMDATSPCGTPNGLCYGAGCSYALFNSAMNCCPTGVAAV